MTTREDERAAQTARDDVAAIDRRLHEIRAMQMELDREEVGQNGERAAAHLAPALATTHVVAQASREAEAALVHRDGAGGRSGHM